MERWPRNPNFNPSHTPERHPGNHLQNFPFPENYIREQSNQNQYGYRNPTLQDNRLNGLESTFSRLNLSTPSVQSPSPFPAMYGTVPGSVANNSYGLSAYELLHSQQLQLELQRLRIQSAINGQQQMNLNGAQSSYGGYMKPYSTPSLDFQIGKFNNGEVGNSYNNFLYKNYNNNHNNKSSSRSRTNYSSLEELRGRIALTALEHQGCVFLQKKLRERNPEEIEMIFLELKDSVCLLMADQSGNLLMQKLFEVCNEQQISEIVALLINNQDILMAICLDMHGTRSMQKLLERLTTQEQISSVVSVLWPITVILSKNMNGHHVIQYCFKLFSNEDNKNFLNEIAEGCYDLATNKSGCCVVQQGIARAQGEVKERIVAEITTNALLLSQNPYGNYVVQYVLGLRIPRFTMDIIGQLTNSYVPLSLNKYGSNVVEKCLNESTEEQSTRIISEIINCPNLLMLLQDSYGNFVAQSAVVIAKGIIRNKLISKIEEHYPFLHSHPYGKKVLARTRGSKRHM